MTGKLNRRISRRRRRVFVAESLEQLETRQLLTSGVISGSVFHDGDADGTHDAGEQGIAGVLVRLDGATESGEAVARRYLTQADGSFEFTGLQAGTYSVTESQPASITDGEDSTATSGVDAQNDLFANIQISDTGEVTDLGFGEGLIAPELLSPVWLFASSGTEEFQREMRATLEEEIGNDDLAAAIREGATEVGPDFDLNQSPNGLADEYSIELGQTLNVSRGNGVLSNDTDPEGSSLTAVLVEGPANGTLDLNTDGSFTYRPTSSDAETDTFTYTASDGFRQSSTTTVTITLTNPNAGFEVDASTAAENDVVGAVQPLNDFGTDDVVFDFADPIDDERLRLLPDDHVDGLDEAPMMLIEYVDFACPACAAYHEQVLDDADFRTDNTDLLIVYRYLPLLEGFNAREAATAAEAVSRQDSAFFSVMTDLLFDNQGEWRISDDPNSLFEDYINGSSIGSDPNFSLAQYRQDLESQEIQDRIDRDLNVATDLGYTATPTFVLQGSRITNPGTQTELLGPFNQVIQEARVESQLEEFNINRRTGEIIVQNADALSSDSSPIDLVIDIRSVSESESLDVPITVNP